MKNFKLLPIFILTIFITFGLTASTSAKDITIMNNSGKTIEQLYLIPSINKGWGDDKLGDKVIPDGGSFTVTGLVVAGKTTITPELRFWDLKVVFHDRQEESWLNINLSELSTIWIDKDN